MDKEIILQLLNNIKNKKYVGTAPIEAVEYAIKHDLIERTTAGNFSLSQKGEDFLTIPPLLLN